jgi:hypothetical protein
MPNATATSLNKVANEKTNLIQEFYKMEPIHVKVKEIIFSGSNNKTSTTFTV